MREILGGSIQIKWAVTKESWKLEILAICIVQKYSPDVDLYALHKLNRYDAV